MSETIPETMRAMQLAAPAPAEEAPLRLVELPVPEPGPGQVDVTVEFAGEYVTVPSGTRFTIGREGDLAIDDNRFLHRHFLSLEQAGGLWWLINIGTRLSATVTDTEGRVQAQLAPGARLPIVFGVTTIVFSAGATTYELSVHSAQPAFREGRGSDELHLQSPVHARARLLQGRQLVRRGRVLAFRRRVSLRLRQSGA